MGLLVLVPQASVFVVVGIAAPLLSVSAVLSLAVPVSTACKVLVMAAVPVPVFAVSMQAQQLAFWVKTQPPAVLV